jgi:predicted ATP-grasp superfamily ATP-dependent carboligase
VTGALVIGADYRALGVVRSLGRRGVPAWVLRHGDDRLAGFSRFAQRTFPLVEGPGFLFDLCRQHRLDGWTLFASSDESAAFVAHHHRELGERFRLTTPPWAVTQYAYDKRLTYPLAESLGLDVPQTWYPQSRDDVAALDCAFPVVLKPAVKDGFNRLTAAKAWRVDSREELVARYDEACELVDPATLMVQELIPGGGSEQLSYAAICEAGRTLASLTARRTRQYPMDFGRASTYVETADLPEVEEPARKLLERIGYTGLVEVEFKRDPRDGRCKLLDVNPRVWGWHTLCARAGIDFTYLAWQLAHGETVLAGTARSGVRWSRLSTDLPAVVTEIRRGRLSVQDYLRSLRGPREHAIFARDDLLPGLLELPLLASVLARRLARGSGV